MGDDATGPRKPLTPRGCDLRGFEYMPLSVTRLLRSKSWVHAAKNDPAIGFFMMNLWASSWHNVPAASHDNDDTTLAHAAMCHDAQKWAEVRDKVLAAWVLCSDGRLYHPVVAKKAREAVALQQKRAAAGSIGGKRKIRQARAKHVLSNRIEMRGEEKRTTPTLESESSGDVLWSSRDGDDDRTTPRSVSKKSEQGGRPLAEAVAAFNAAAARAGWPIVTAGGLTKHRGTKLRARLRELGGDGTLAAGLDRWREAMNKAAGLAFMRGEKSNGKHAGWRASFDFFLKAGRVALVLDGSYDDRTGEGGAHDEGNIGRGVRALLPGNDGAG